MRYAFINTLNELAEKDKNIYLLVGDLGFSVVESFAQKFPERFLNCGIAEQNMIGLAAGLALEGKKPYVFSIIPFATLRCLEQIKNDLCYQNLDVKIIGVGSGFAYGGLGATHFAIEDTGVLRTLPNMTVLCPADPAELEILMKESYFNPTPCYIRIGRGKERNLYSQKPNLKIGEPSVLEEGKDGVIIGSGTITDDCQRAVFSLRESGINLKLISMHTLKPINKELLLKEITAAPFVFTVEEHNIINGLGSAVAEVIAESKWRGHFKRLGVTDEYTSDIGGDSYLRSKYNIGHLELEEQIKKYLQ